MKKLMKISRVLTLSIAGLALTAGALAAECPWLKAEALDVALPQYGPWTVADLSGAGSCRFQGEASRERGVRYELPILTLTQQAQSSPSAAANFAKHLRQSLPKEYTTTAVPMLGAQAFSYDMGSDARSVAWTAHEGSLGLMASFTHRTTVSPEERVQVQRVIAQALKGAAAPAAQQAALACPYFDAAVLKTLLPGAGLKVQRFGADSCMANTDDNAVVMFTRHAGKNEADAAAQIKIMASNGTGCIGSPQPDLSPAALLVHGCKDGNPRASVIFSKGTKTFTFAHIPNGKAPTPAQHQQLIALARAAASGSASN